MRRKARVWEKRNTSIDVVACWTPLKTKAFNLLIEVPTKFQWYCHISSTRCFCQSGTTRGDRKLDRSGLTDMCSTTEWKWPVYAKIETLTWERARERERDVWNLYSYWFEKIELWLVIGVSFQNFLGGAHLYIAIADIFVPISSSTVHACNCEGWRDWTKGPGPGWWICTWRNAGKVHGRYRSFVRNGSVFFLWFLFVDWIFWIQLHVQYLLHS